jgi:hypothetical protein
MKTTLYILKIVILMALSSCGQPNDKTSITVVATDSLQEGINKKEKERLEKRRAIEEQEYADSLRLDDVLQDALKLANQSIGKDKFVRKYEVSADSIPVSVEVNLDYHITKNNPHLIIRRSEPSAIYIDIYTKGKSTFEKVVTHKEWNMTYVNDTIRDINGDGLNDFVVNWYGSTGCCLKAFSNVYLLRKDKKSFSGDFQFINPTFSPQEKIIRGVCYGHPSETEMYKFKWNGENVDTLEYVSYQKTKKGKTGKIIISTDRPHGDQFKILQVLNSVPTEYRNIEGYEWFTGEGYE